MGLFFYAADAFKRLQNKMKFLLSVLKKKKKKIKKSNFFYKTKNNIYIKKKYN